MEELVELRAEPKEFIDAGEFVVVPVHLIVRGQESGASIEEDEVHLLRLGGGKVTELREYRERDEALKVVGLEAQPSANLDLVRSIYPDWELGDFSSGD